MTAPQKMSDLVRANPELWDEVALNHLEDRDGLLPIDAQAEWDEMGEYERQVLRDEAMARMLDDEAQPPAVRAARNRVAIRRQIRLNDSLFGGTDDE